MVVTAPAVRELRQEQLDVAARLLVRAFDDDPLNRVLFRSACHRRRLFDAVYRAKLQAAMGEGQVYACIDGESLRGVIVLSLPAVAGRRSLRSRSRQRPDFGALVRVAPSALAAVPAATRLLLTQLPGVRDYAVRRRVAVASVRERRAWHLAGLAVDPDHQGRGVARMLLDHVLARADCDGAPVWLETNYASNVPLYQRFGFDIIAHTPPHQVLPPWWLMMREPSAAPQGPAS